MNRHNCGDTKANSILRRSACSTKRMAWLIVLKSKASSGLPVQASADRAILRGAALSLLERWPEAAAEYHAALAATPEPGPELLNGVAWADLKQGKKVEAALLLDRSLRLRLDQPEIARLRATLPAPAPGPR